MIAAAYCYLMRRAVFAMLTLSALLLSASQAAAATTNVAVGTFYFDPAQVNILINDSVQWNWVETPGYFHSTTHFGALWNSPVQMTGSFTFMFTNTGYYPYVCTLHQWMYGSVSVRYPPPAISNPQRVAGEFRFTYSAITNAWYIVESSTDLTQWRGETTNKATAATVSYTNAALHNLQYYRVRRLFDP